MSHGTCPTVQIQSEPSEGNPSGIVVINECDFDAETMVLATVSEEDEAPVETKTPEAPKAPVEVAPAPKATGKAGKVVAPWAA